MGCSMRASSSGTGRWRRQDAQVRGARPELARTLAAWAAALVLVALM